MKRGDARIRLLLQVLDQAFTAKGWQGALLRDGVRRLAPSRLDARVGKSRWAVAEQIHGIAAHDLYHTGQIQLLKALRRGRKR